MKKESTQQINFHEISQEKKSLRESLSKEKGKGGIEDILEEELTNIKEGLKDSIKEAGGISAVKELLKVGKQEVEKKHPWLDEQAIEKEVGVDYQAIAELSAKLAKLIDDETKLLREAQINATSQAVFDRLRDKIIKAKFTLAKDIKKKETKNPIAFRANELVSYKKGLYQEGHIAPVPSVKEALNEIGLGMILGKPMLLYGPTGGGKTSLARFAAKHFTNKDAEMVYCTSQTREANIWGKTGLEPAGKEGMSIKTVDIYGPLTKAMQEGKIVIFDEFTALPKEQMVFIKGIFNAKIGDIVNVVGNGKIKIMPGFQMIFTANLKSEKNPERQELPPEIAREFEQNNLKIDYTPEDEAYDIMLARLMNKDGSINASYHDLYETLPKFCEAIAEIQIAYTEKESDAIARLTGTKDASGKTQGLKKLVLTQGTVENIIDAWKIEKATKKDGISFVEFLDLRLKRTLTLEEYSEKDRILAAKILASKGFLRTLSAKDLNLPQEIFDVDATKKLRGEEVIAKIKVKSANEKKIFLKKLADLDSFGKRQKKAIEQAMQFLPKEKNTLTLEMNAKKKLLENNHQFLIDTFTQWYNQNDAENAKQSVEIISPKDIDWDIKKDDKDESKFGEYTMNSEIVIIDWEKIPAEKIKIFDFADFVGRPRAELAKHLVENYSDKYHIPGIEYWKYLYENRGKIPQNLKDENCYFFFGSILRGKDGNWDIPYSYWHGGKWNRNAHWLGNDWDSDDRVFLLEK